ncbi:MAG: histidinol-phosphate transaminase [Acidimicrobiales bacterium]
MTLPTPRDDLALRPGYHSRQVDVAVRLNTNESPWPPPQEWLDAWRAELADLASNRYPDRSALALRTAIGELHGVGAENVFAANGSNEVLQCVCLAYGGAGRRALTFEPTYALHSHIAHLTGTEVVEAGRLPNLTLDPVEAAATRAMVEPAITFICSPNNPTGMVEPRSTVEALLGAWDVLVVVDEAYGPFASWSALDLLGDDVPLVVTRTFSKTWSMAGLRLGYLVGPAPVVEVLQRVALPYHLDAAKQAAGRLALAFQDEMRQRVEAVVAERDRIMEALFLLPVTTWPSEANFVLFRPDNRKGDEVWEALLADSVLVRNASSWPHLEGCLRVTVGTPEENDTFLTALTEALR